MDMEGEVKPGMKSRFVESSELGAEFSHGAKALFAFEEIDGTDICFFGMDIQGDGSKTPSPNTRSVYIAYLDYLHFFQPGQYRTAVYHEILLGYLDYAKRLGYTMAHITGCPPAGGDDYIFHCHPPQQKVPNPKTLEECYTKMLDKGIIKKITSDYKDIVKQATENNLSSAAEQLYLEGNFRPNALEESIKELDQGEEAEVAEAMLLDENEQEPDRKEKEIAEIQNTKNHSDQQQGNNLSAKIFATMEKHKEVFFVIKFKNLTLVQNPNPLVNCDRFSTLCDLYELHNQGQDKFVYICNHCKSHFETRDHCKVSDDYDLCISCHEKGGHSQKMENVDLDMDVGSSPGNTKQADSQERRMLAIQQCTRALLHTCQCHDVKCLLPSCRKMRRVVQHTTICKRKAKGGCPFCTELTALCCHHAKHCQELDCRMPYCSSIKQRLWLRQLREQVQQRLQQHQVVVGPTLAACVDAVVESAVAAVVDDANDVAEPAFQVHRTVLVYIDETQQVSLD